MVETGRISQLSQLEILQNWRMFQDCAKLHSQNYLLFVEHNHVYTIGKSGDYNNLLLNENSLQQKGIQLKKIGRGGDITYHGPGQIVCYPIFDLENFFTDIHKYLRLSLIHI